MCGRWSDSRSEGALHAVVEAVVLGAHHVDVAFDERVPEAVSGELGAEVVERLPLIADWAAQHVGHDARHVVRRKVLGAQHRNLARPRP